MSNPNTDLFDAYFRKADLDGDGQISEVEAVVFFQGSSLPKQVLAQVWMHADQGSAGFLSRTEFCNALKLVTVAQSKRELTPDIVKAALYGPAAAKIPAPQINHVDPVEQLVSMLRVDSPESALRILISLAYKDERNNIKIVEAGALEPIISFLQSQSLQLQESATEFLFLLSAFDINKPLIVSSGAIPLLVKILGHESQQVNINAMKALLVLSKDPNNLNIILGTNPIPLIVDFLKKCDESSEITEMCSALIESLVGCDEGRIALTSVEDGVLTVVEVLKNGSLETKKYAAGALLTMCRSDRSKFREPTLREGIILELEKIAVPGEPELLLPELQLKARTLLLLLSDSPYSQRVPRVTVYHVNNNGEWVEHGIRYVSIDHWKESKQLCLFVIAEEDEKSLLHQIRPNDVYGHLQDEVIQWRDSENSYLALRFHETRGFSYIWGRICSEQTIPLFNTLNTSSHQIIGSNSKVGSVQKVILEWIFVITNFILELPSAAFDQFSSVQKPEYALIAMVMSFVAILVSVVELIYKGNKERVMWRGRRRIPWFYYPSNKRFGTFADIVGLGCAIFQFIVTTINYSFICRNVDGPIKISAWPIIFILGVLSSKFLEKTYQN